MMSSHDKRKKMESKIEEIRRERFLRSLCMNRKR